MEFILPSTLSELACSLFFHIYLFILYPDRSLPSLSSHFLPPHFSQSLLSTLYNIEMALSCHPPAHEGSAVISVSRLLMGKWLLTHRRKWLAPVLHSEVFAQWMAEK